MDSSTRRMSLTDIGSRYNHYYELLNLFESSKTISEGYLYKSPETLKRIKSLESAIALIRKEIDTISGYPTTQYYLKVQIEEAHVQGKKQIEQTRQEANG